MKLSASDAPAIERLALLAVLAGVGCAILVLTGLAAYRFFEARLAPLESL